MLDTTHDLGPGDLIYNVHRNGIFVITRLVYESPTPNYTLAGDHLHFVCSPVTIQGSELMIGKATVPVTVNGSKRLTYQDIRDMMMDATSTFADHTGAIKELSKMVTE